MEIFSFSATTFSQSSKRPTMIVQTGPIVSMGRPSFSRRVQAALDGFGDGDALRQREADGGVDADAAIRRFFDGGDSGARWREFSRSCWARSLSNSRVCFTIASVLRKRRGSVWMERRPFLPFC